MIWEKLSHKNAIKIVWGVIFRDKKIGALFGAFCHKKGRFPNPTLWSNLLLTLIKSKTILFKKTWHFFQYFNFHFNKQKKIFFLNYRHSSFGSENSRLCRGRNRMVWSTNWRFGSQKFWLISMESFSSKTFYNISFQNRFEFFVRFTRHWNTAQFANQN